MKRILLLGDSIRESYQPKVVAKLDGLAEVLGPGDNCRWAKYTLWHLNKYLARAGKVDIVHWNNGIWDVFKRIEGMGNFTPIPEYLTHLKFILQELRKTGAVILWATTTPSVPDELHVPSEDIDKYNEASVKFMQEQNVEIDDLNEVCKRNLELYIRKDNSHLTEEGMEACADAVVNAVRKYL